jgi:hypothetical protein
VSSKSTEVLERARDWLTFDRFPSCSLRAPLRMAGALSYAIPRGLRRQFATLGAASALHPQECPYNERFTGIGDDVVPNATRTRVTPNIQRDG